MKRSVVLLLALIAAARAEPPPSLGVAALPKVERRRASAPLDAPWKTFEGHVSPNFKVDLPGAPKASTFAIGRFHGTRLDLTVAPDVAYTVAYADVVDVVDVEASLDAAVATAVTTSGGKLDSKVRELDVDGNPARDARIKLGTGAVIAVRFVAANLTMYELAAGDARRANPDKFFASFSVEISGGLIGNLPDDGCRLQSLGGMGMIEGFAKIRAAKVDGGLDPAIVRRCIMHAFDSVRSCYSQYLFQKHKVPRDFTGDVTAMFAIAFDGTVASARATGFDVDVATCIADTIRSIGFPPPRHKKVAATFTFRFTPQR